LTFTEKRNLYLLLAGRLISLVGSGIQAIAIPLFILDLSGSGTLMGIFAIVSIVPALLASPFAGIIGDRSSKKKIMVCMDMLRGIIVFAMAFMAYTGTFNLPVLFLCQCLISFSNSFFSTASVSIIPELIQRESIGKANALRSSMDNVSMIAGPLMGGIIYGVWGIEAVFLFNAVSFILSGLLENLLVYKSQPSRKEKFSASFFMNQVKEVVTLINTNTNLKKIFTFILFVNLFDTPVLVVILPFIYKKMVGFSSQQFGVLQSVLMLGMLLGNLLFAMKLSKISAGKLFHSSNINQFVFTFVLSIVTIPLMMNIIGKGSWLFFSLSAFLLVIIGLSNAISSVILTTFLQKSVAKEMLARFFSIAFIFIEVANPVGAFMFGVLLDIIPFYIVFIGISIVLLVGVTLFMSISKSIFEPVGQ
jgi:MFS transporter, DHA3 family, macrolide efflux protein